MQHQAEPQLKSSKFCWSRYNNERNIYSFRYVIDQGAIPPLCELLSVTDTKIIQVAFNGLENILKLGAAEAKRTNGANPYAIMIEECFGNYRSIVDWTVDWMWKLFLLDF